MQSHQSTSPFSSEQLIDSWMDSINRCSFQSYHTLSFSLSAFNFSSSLLLSFFPLSFPSFSIFFSIPPPDTVQYLCIDEMKSLSSISIDKYSHHLPYPYFFLLRSLFIIFSFLLFITRYSISFRDKESIQLLDKKWILHYFHSLILIIRSSRRGTNWRDIQWYFWQLNLFTKLFGHYNSGSHDEEWVSSFHINEKWRAGFFTRTGLIIIIISIPLGLPVIHNGSSANSSRTASNRSQHSLLQNPFRRE